MALRYAGLAEPLRAEAQAPLRLTGITAAGPASALREWSLCARATLGPGRVTAPGLSAACGGPDRLTLDQTNALLRALTYEYAAAAAPSEQDRVSITVTYLGFAAELALDVTVVEASLRVTGTPTATPSKTPTALATATSSPTVVPEKMRGPCAAP